jgi:peptidoglycan LD-endopeptidase CwlK
MSETSPEITVDLDGGTCVADGSSAPAEEKALEQLEEIKAATERPEPRNALVELPPAAAKVEEPEVELELDETDIIEAKPEPEPPADPGVFKRVNLALLYGPFREKVEQLLSNCEKRGARFFVLSGLRTLEEQEALYAQGRTKPGKIITKARGGESLHNFGIAVDVCRDADRSKPGLQPDWDIASYRILHEEAQKLGLETGWEWKFRDVGHIQLSPPRNDIELRTLKSLLINQGMRGVWHLLDKHRW